ncbi:hypothetical protein HORM4_160013 [Vibrio harveyi]|nr:hypothetical protein HORM4_160013 [Vibrio harveyi]
MQLQLFWELVGVLDVKIKIVKPAFGLVFLCLKSVNAGLNFFIRKYIHARLLNVYSFLVFKY